MLSVLFLAFASVGATFFSISTEESCVDCPTFAEINEIFPDTTNPKVSGGFVNGMREPPLLQKEWLWYKEQGIENVTWLDPPYGIMTRSNHITIVNNLDTYKIPGISNKMINGTITFGTDRWIDDRCNKAIISKDNWILLVGDTMQYMKNDCNKEFTMINDTYTVSFAKTIMDHTTSYKYKFEKWVEESLNKCLGLC